VTEREHSQFAEDLVQACLLKAMPRWQHIAEPMTYLRRVMVNQRVSWWRRLRRELPQADPPDRVAPDDIGGADPGPDADDPGMVYLKARPAASQVVIRAVDATGADIATTWYREPDTTGQYFGERVVDGWR
jgi:DNA-directed RNA polymerase specialized sigma24 family protein